MLAMRRRSSVPSREDLWLWHGVQIARRLAGSMPAPRTMWSTCLAGAPQIPVGVGVWQAWPSRRRMRRRCLNHALLVRSGRRTALGGDWFQGIRGSA